MHIFQFNHWHKARFSFCFFNRVWQSFSVLFTLFMLLNPSLSHAVTQASQNEVSIKEQSQTKQTVVLVMGDSLSAAYGVEVNQGWVALLQTRYPQLRIINASISGETTSGGKQRLDFLLKKYQPKVLIIELGANDALRGQNLKVSQQNIQSMIDRCPQYNPECQVVLLGVQLPTNYGPAYDSLFKKMYRDLAANNTLLFDPFFIEPVALDPDLMQWDGLHPNAKAQPIILERVTSLFKKLKL